METNGNIKGIFQLAGEKMGWSSTGPPIAFLQNGTMIRSPAAITDIQMCHYIDKIRHLELQLPASRQDPLQILRSALQRWDNTATLPTLTLQPVTLMDTVNCLKKLSNGTPFRHNLLDATSIKIAADSLVNPINFLTNLSITTKKFANKWRITKVIPLYKGGGKDRHIPDSYRPISLLPVMAKLVEMVVHGQINRHMEENALWNQNNHAYCKYTTTAMIQLCDMIFEAANQNVVSTIMAIDQLAAFDSIQHNILKEKLKLYNFSNGTINWITEYISHRTQYVSIGGVNSTMKPVRTRIPQGSVLGPALYSLHVNKLSDVVNNHTECQEQIHRNTEQLFGNACKKYGNVVNYADYAENNH